MNNKSLTTFAPVLALIGAVASPAQAHSFDREPMMAIKAFASAPIDDQTLATAAGGFAPRGGNLFVIVREALDRNFSIQAGIGREMMDNWFAVDGATLISVATTP